MKPSLLPILFLIILAHPILAQTDTLQWNVIMGGRNAGFVKQLKNSDGSYTEWFQYNDRGRGDSTVSRYKQNEQGYITWMEGTGKDYFKKPVFEKFSLADGTASWENPSEKDQRAVTGNVEYIPLKINSGMSFKPYFSTPGQAVTLLPSGTRKLTVLKEQTAGNTTVRLVAMAGVGLKPSYSWIDDKHDFFAAPSDWFAIIRKGYEDQNAALLAAQQVYEQNYFKELATKLRHTIKTGIALTNATVFDPKTGTVKRNSTVLIEKGMIELVSQKSAIPNSFRVIDVKNKFVMPGLWDMHVHYNDATDGLLHLANGVTNVRDMGNGEALLERIKEIDDGTVLGPRIQARCGFIDGAGPYAGPTGARINTPEEGIAAIQKYATQGYTQIKLYSSLKPEWVKPLADEAHRLGLRVSGHIPAHMLASEAIDAGYDEIQHLNMVLLNFMGKDLDTRTPVRFHAVAQNAANLNLDGPEVKAFIKQLKDKKTVIDPTISFFETMFVQSTPQPTMTAVIDRLPLELQRNFRSGGALDIPAGQEATYAASYQKMLQMVKLLYDNGITIEPGTDDFPGFVLHKELENYAKAGIPNAAVLKIATLQSATVAGKDKQYGTLEAGKVADIIVIDGDPLKAISDIRKVEMVIKGQEVYEAKEMLEAVSIKYFK